MSTENTLEEFFEGIRSSCNEHAKRKGYTKQAAGVGDVGGPLLRLLNVEREHAIGEIALKLLEFQVAPRRVILEKCVGWLWRMWIECKE